LDQFGEDKDEKADLVEAVAKRRKDSLILPNLQVGVNVAIYCPETISMVFKTRTHTKETLTCLLILTHVFGYT
jgi:hypothetical protein